MQRRRKKVYWYSTFGKIEAIEPIFRQSGKRFRPFILSAGVSTRGCSLPLQRAMTDFAADDAFAQVPIKLKEHYGIEMPTSTIRVNTLKHAKAMYELQNQEKQPTPATGVSVQIGEADGCMIPIMASNDQAKDKRKEKTLSWKEARLALVHEQGSVSPIFTAHFNANTDTVGHAWKNCAIKAGFGDTTYFHSVGDGAPWIAKQVNKHFGTQGSYLIDFYHLCEYLAEAAKFCVDINPEGWIKQQKAHLKESHHKKVIKNLKPFIEADDIDNEHAPVRACHRYLSNRTDQLDYKRAIEKGLPIGSGEIESAHRYVIQKRLKLSGAWWKASNVDPMLTLRVVRANNEWDKYWCNLQEAS